MTTKKQLRIIINILKVFLSFCNSLSLICGSLLFGCGIYSILTLQNIVDIFVDFNPVIIPSVLIGLGAFISITATTGFCLACNVRKGVVYLHITLLLLVFTAIVSGGVLILVYESKLYNGLASGFQEHMNNYRVAEPETWRTINEVQKLWGCCGIENAEDWKNTTSGIPPESCCSTTQNCWTKDELSDSFSARVTNGCLFKIFGEENFSSNVLVSNYYNLNIFMTSIFGFASLQLLVAVLACIVAHKVRELRHFSYHTSAY